METDLDEVLQIERVFSNVQRGEVWGKEELRKVFDGMSVKSVCKEILHKGALQQSEKEREMSNTRNLQVRDFESLVLGRLTSSTDILFIQSPLSTL